MWYTNTLHIQGVVSSMKHKGNAKKEQTAADLLALMRLSNQPYDYVSSLNSKKLERFHFNGTMRNV